ncbi:hypothetical protein SeMB42_g03319 [Synchytrium endobioticum]|uniref:Uncharacterized protein n=1 Tax=Synchytrium endobioticum TaxID=286115 RepID=A0A507D984_9FUNG|nr:hypothetical protein SeMB42_g03321 [Synchytrium endobioticum]TPX47440.1 hypothetical protein SeMB42_g03319 [Synchytrium endobioticum]
MPVGCGSNLETTGCDSNLSNPSPTPATHKAAYSASRGSYLAVCICRLSKTRLVVKSPVCGIQVVIGSKTSQTHV